MGRSAPITAALIPSARFAIASLLSLLAMAVTTVIVTAEAHGQQGAPQPQDALVDRPISDVRLEGLQRVSEQTVRNNIRSAVGAPYDPEIVRADVARLNRLGQFRFVDGIAQLQQDGSVVVLFRFVEQAIITEVQVVGNRLIADEDLLAVVPLVPGGPRDDFLIQNARRTMEELYRRRGHYLTNVTVNDEELNRAGLLIFQINEGPRVKVRAVEFQGNEAFSSDQLNPEIKTESAMFLIRRGELDEEVLAADVASLDRYYKDRGYMDVRVDRQIEISPDGTEAKVTFVIAEGPRYTVRNVRAVSPDGQPLRVFAPEQIAAIMELKSGDVYSRDLLRKSIRAIQDSYGLMGYMLSEEERQITRSENWTVQVRESILRVQDQPQLDLLLEIDEGAPMRVGEVQIQGNFLTRDRVIRRELRGITPGRMFDVSEIEESENRLIRTRLFNDARITIQRENPTEPGFRDVLVEIKERNTGSVNFGVALGSDSGVFGELSLTQNNFDITDMPESFQELFFGRAFRGAGQRFNATLRPGTELFQYVMSVTEPHLFDSEYSLTVAGQFRDRYYDLYDERRFGTSISLGRQFGDVWSASLRNRVEQIQLDDIDDDAPLEVFADEGPDVLTTLGVGIVRSTIPPTARPGSGSRFELSFDRYGALGGDLDFNLVNAEYTVYFTVDEDFLGRISTLRLTTRTGYIFDGHAPTYESFYLGGRSLRGFDFRTVSPRGTLPGGAVSDESVGGDWLFFLGAQYEVPLFTEALSGVIFIDSGTVTDKVQFDPYRVAAGFGIRLYIPQFGQLPLAFDFGFPLIKEDDDEERLFSFSAEIPW